MNGIPNNNKKFKSIMLLLICTGVLFSSISAVKSTANPQQSGANEKREASARLQDTNKSYKKGSYDEYISVHSSSPRPDEPIMIPADSFTHSEGMNPEILKDYEGFAGNAVKTDEQGTISWDIEVPREGLFNIGITYFPIEGKSASIERGVEIDGKTPFIESANLKFSRVWGNAQSSMARDTLGNDLRPEQAEKPDWQEAMFQDGEGYYEEPFAYYFTKGKHRITLKSEREPLVIGELKLFQNNQPPAYADMKALYGERGYEAFTDKPIVVQGEEAAYKSSPTLYPIADRSTPAVEPYSASKIRINTIGGNNWRIPGQWIVWNITVPKSGLYKIGIRAKQNLLRGMYSSRKLTIDGQVPFKEMERIPFYYKSGWQMTELGDGEPYLFYLEEGTHQLKLEVVLGDLAPLIRQVETDILQLNRMYRKILMITGSTPDSFRDYQIEQKIPDMVDTFKKERDSLNEVAGRLEEITGQRSEQVAVLRTMADQLQEMADDPETVPKRLASYTANVGALGTWVLKAREQPLQIDSITIAAPTAKLPRSEGASPAKVWHELRSFMNSFFIDYNEIGSISDTVTDKTINVWVGSGRDQAQVIKSMIDTSFTPATGIGVNVKLVPLNLLLPATLANQGPDVTLQVGSDVPVNYAMRNAVEDLTRFPDYPKVAERFRDSAIVPYRYGEGVYALPETQTFNVLFYRKDILEQLNLAIPDTWEDVYDMLPVLDKNHMDFGLPQMVQLQAGQNPDPNPTMAMLLYQLGGSFYKNEGKASDIDSEIGVKAFKEWTEFYTDYGLPTAYDFANRFRTGEMPIGIADYTTYNQLTVFAPEIRGLWNFAPVPGRKQEGGDIRREVSGSGSGIVMMKQAIDKESSWEFMKWWTDEATQTRFGREMEGLMGAAARYPTANIEALEKLPWPAQDFRNLTEQFQWVRGIPQVPGGYFTGRHLDNAFWKVINGGGGGRTWGGLWVTIDDHAGPREALEDYVQYINDEIRQKRREFKLPE
ncbi:extracellular solute-binding protein [Paenibacillus spongiae]|uniref:Extracellular solute-binding protein n=1 Tax=Paenibacillus spongiae TaxID=2909671 RepID=A0ABY5SHM5_9BACL|nr:extracellular solute-binding protein [Paenibacillus spongiae]UVI31980.1 extracellular solute-binding protein [Paenibacillus spongiae]